MATAATGGIGFAITCLNTILTTLPKIEEITRTMKEHQRQADNLYGRLLKITAQLDHWNRDWEPLCERRFSGFWGESYQRVQTCRQNIAEIVQEIEKEIAEQLYSGSRMAKAASASMFAIYRKGKLREKLTELEERTDQLKEFSRHALSRLQKETGESQRQDIDKEMRFTKFSKTLTHYAHLLYQGVSNQSGASWSLELTTPDRHGPDLSNWDSTEDVDLDFNVKYQAEQDVDRLERFRIHYTSVLCRSPDDEVSLFPMMVLSGNSPIGVYQRLEQCHLRSYPYRRLLAQGIFSDPRIYKAWENDRTALMFGLANWMILLWGSSWTSSPCTCGIRFTDYKKDAQPEEKDLRETSKKITQLLSEKLRDVVQPNYKVRQHALTSNPDHKCDLINLDQQKLLLLGITLAELTLGSPLAVNLDQRYTVVRHNQELSRAGLLQQIGRRSSRIKDVVAYCLDHEPIDPANNVSLQFLEEFLEKAWRPLKEYHEIVSQQRTDMFNTAWWQSLWSVWPPQNVYEIPATRRDSYSTISERLDTLPGSFPSEPLSNSRNKDD